MHSDYLVHHGIIGQKWGIRRYQNSDGTLTVAGKKRLGTSDKARNKAETKARLDDAKNRKMLTDAQLKKKIERLKLEQELKRLTDSECAPGRKFMKDISSDLGKKVIVTAGAGALLYGGKALISKNFDSGELADAIFRGGAKKK